MFPRVDTRSSKACCWPGAIARIALPNSVLLGFARYQNMHSLNVAQTHALEALCNLNVQGVANALWVLAMPSGLAQTRSIGGI